MSLPYGAGPFQHENRHELRRLGWTSPDRSRYKRVRRVVPSGPISPRVCLPRTVAMLAEPLYPLRFEPILKELIWGGRRLGTVLSKPLGAGMHYAESWEIADHRDDVSRVAEGPLKGVPLRDLVR